ncbi:MAG: ROK family protein [Dehalococcoidia bacterium]
MSRASNLTDTPADGMPPAYVLAADIGGTSMRAAIVDGHGRVVVRRRIETEPGRGLIDAAERLAEAMRGVIAEAGIARVLAVGISTAGPLDPATGTYRHPPNLRGWHGLSMVPALTAAFGVPVVVGHDATLAALAETRFGHRRGARDLVYLTVSTGIGAGIVAGGRPVTGSTGGAGEAGHLIVRPGGPRCGAGCPGCLEGVSSGSAMARAAHEAVSAGRATTLTAEAQAPQIFAAALAGDAVATEIVEGVVEGLATGLAGLLAILDPEAIVTGGGLVRELAPWWERLLERTREIALPRYEAGVPVEPTTLADDAGLLGASLIAIEAVAG